MVQALRSALRRCEDMWRDQRSGLGEGRCAGNGWPINGQRGGELRFIGGANAHNVCAGEAMRVSDELPLSMEVANRAVVDHSILAITLPGYCSLFRGELGRSMTEAGKRVQRRAAQGNDTVERQKHAQQKLIRALGAQVTDTLEFKWSSHWIDASRSSPTDGSALIGVSLNSQWSACQLNFAIRQVCVSSAHRIQLSPHSSSQHARLDISGFSDSASGNRHKACRHSFFGDPHGGRF